MFNSSVWKKPCLSSIPLMKRSPFYITSTMAKALNGLSYMKIAIIGDDHLNLCNEVKSVHGYSIQNRIGIVSMSSGVWAPQRSIN